MSRLCLIHKKMRKSLLALFLTLAAFSSNLQGACTLDPNNPNGRCYIIYEFDENDEIVPVDYTCLESIAEDGYPHHYNCKISIT